MHNATKRIMLCGVGLGPDRAISSDWPVNASAAKVRTGGTIFAKMRWVALISREDSALFSFRCASGDHVFDVFRHSAKIDGY
jgi:hypothetical protein